MNYLIVLIFYTFLFSVNSSENKAVLSSHETNKVIYISKSSLPMHNFGEVLRKNKITYTENNNYFLAYELDFIKLITILSHNSSSFNEKREVNAYHWRCVKSIAFQQKIAHEFTKSNIHHALFKNSSIKSQAPPYCYMFYSKDKNKIYSIEKAIKKSEITLTSSIIKENKSSYINYDFSLEELRFCDIALVAKFVMIKENTEVLIIDEILKDKTNLIKVGDLLSPYSYRGIRKDTDSGAFFCSRYGQSFLNFFNKEKSISINSGLVSVDTIRNFLINISEHQNHNKENGNHQFNVRKPYVMNRAFFIEDINDCEVLLVSNFFERSGKTKLVISEVIHDKTNSISIGDTLTTIPFRKTLDSDFIGALFCRRHHADFLNFFNKLKLIEPDQISIDEIQRKIKK